MANENPYAPPDSNVEVTGSSELASRGARLGAAIIDTVIFMAVIFPAMYLTGFWEKSMGGQQTIVDNLSMAGIGFVAFILLNAYLLTKRGQTIGKSLVKIRIVSVDDDRILSLGKVISLRYAPIWIVQQIPVAGPLLGLIDPLFIFRSDRRCIHDLIAGTRVVNA
jgi:uncharacterized RDD family membrane protein YckC